MKYVGKVLGTFVPETNHIDIDPLNLLNEYQLRKTSTNEWVHKAQEVVGNIYRNSRYAIEKAADAVTRRLMKEI